MTSSRQNVDVAIVGAGLAGLWLANALRERGFSIALCEARAVGGIQSSASQGIIHGGLKYALGGALTGASETLAGMPARWRAIPDLPILASEFYLWFRGGSSPVVGRLTGFLANTLLAERVSRVADADWPAPFRPPTTAPAGTTGRLYRLDDLVVDVAALTRALTAPCRPYILPLDVTRQMLIRDAGHISAIRSGAVNVTAKRFVFAAGAGNGPLTNTPAQRRGLRQIVVRPDKPLSIYAHCVRGLAAEPALTITTHGEAYYLGGQLAGRLDGSRAEQIARAKAELAHFFPWLDWQKADYEVFEVERAEYGESGRRPNGPTVTGRHNWLACWPTKLTLIPEMADQVLARLVDLTPIDNPWPGEPNGSVRFAEPPY